MEQAKTRYAAVTGSNKGIGFEICRQLAINVAIVVLTARDEKRGVEAVEKLKESGHDNVIFRQLDVTDNTSVHSLTDFIRNHFGKLDILVNNAGIAGVMVKPTKNMFLPIMQEGVQIKWNEGVTQSYELAEQCLKTNYHGTKRMCEALIPLLQLSNSPRIINVSSSMGKLKRVKNEWAKQVLSDTENLTEEKVDEVLNEYLKSYKERSLEANGWPVSMSAYVLSKAAMNAYTRILAKKYPTLSVNCVCPGYVKTDINYNTGVLTAAEGAESCVRLALITNGSPSGMFFYRKEETSFV
ncbi:hypothetical protein Pint_28458 [Pistacia integerrima]|uniref:Uncharacterized protein n=1 Tax=Pistacia integerrima TaxID=434235 RepID=A0ACC0YTB7_9ROSI|nr:hypothetical protein Pint_28458 [Pistacia integerrima]